ncbi:beta strand repeat-containing protein [Azospirillum argentinense]|nr:calcium-binding protein [Azospirillum argentinense]
MSMPVYQGANGNDYIQGSDYADTIYGSSGNDTLHGYSGNDLIDGGAGNDTLYGGDGNDLLDGGDGNDFLVGGNGNDTLIGGAGNDTLYGGGVSSVFRFYANSGYDRIMAGTIASVRTIEIVNTSVSTFTITRSAANLIINVGGSVITAEYHFSSTYGQINYMNFSNGSYYNLVSIAANLADGGSLVLSSNATDTQVGTNGNDTLNGLDINSAISGNEGNDLICGNGGNDTLSGGVGNDTLYGGDGNDLLNGGDGDDLLIGGAGADYLEGAGGLDIVSYTDSWAGVTINLATGTGSGGSAEGDRLVTIEWVYASNHSDVVYGDANANRLWGLDGADSLYGGDGADWLDGGAGADSLNGGDGEDIVTYAYATAGVTIDLAAGTGLYAEAQGDVLISIEGINGSAFNDVLNGGSGGDWLYGAAGDDWLCGRGGADYLEGAGGFDIVSYTDSWAGVTINLATGTGSGGSAEGDRLVTIEGVYASNHSDVVYGDANANRLWGLDGADSLYGGDGADWLDGGAGADSLNGGAGEDIVTYAYATAGVTIDLAAGTGLYAEAQGDVLISIEGINGSAFNDVLNGGSGGDWLYGAAGNDWLWGRAGADYLEGAEGFDVANYIDSWTGVTINLATGTGSGGSAEGDRLVTIEGLYGSYYNDTFYGSVNADYLWGIDGNDTLYGGAGDDTLEGGSGADWLIGGSGADYLDGGAGDDVISYAYATAGVTIDLAAGTGLYAEAQGDVLISIEGINGSAFNDVLNGGNVGEWLYGAAGDDWLCGRGGADYLEGAGGFDIVSYTDSWAGVTINLSAGTGSGGSAEGDRLVTIEGVYASNHSDVVYGDANANRLWGLDGADSLYGGDGADWLDGGAGADYLNGGAGEDIVTYAYATAGVTIDLAAGTGLYAEAQGDVLISIEGINGSAFNDVLNGGSGGDWLYGAAGNDWLWGRAGADYLEGAEGFDVANYIDSWTGVTVNLATGTGSGGSAEGDRLVTIEGLYGSYYNDTFYGSGNADYLWGIDGSDILYGGAGDDTLEGGSGADWLNGGSGADLFVFTSGNGQDAIEDFNAAQGDRIGIALGQSYTVGATSNGNALITFGPDKAVILYGVQPSTVSSAWFITI